jgi:hypothetical protein
MKPAISREICELTVPPLTISREIRQARSTVPLSGWG